MRFDEEEINLDVLKNEILRLNSEYKAICKINFTPINKHFYILAFSISALIWLPIFIIGGVNSSSSLQLIGNLTFMFSFFFILFLSENLELLFNKFYLSNFSIRDIEAIKSNSFLLTTFCEHLTNNKTAVSSQFSKIGINYRNDLKEKIERLSALKEQLEREILIESIQ